MSLSKWAIFSAGILLSAQVWAAGPALTVGNATGKAGDVVELPVTFDPGKATIAGIQFNLALPSGTSVTSVAAGDTSAATGKSVNFNHQGDNWTFIVFGINKTASKSGTLFTAKVQLPKDMKPGTTKIPASNIVYTDPSGKSIPPGKTKPGSIILK